MAEDVELLPNVGPSEKGILFILKIYEDKYTLSKHLGFPREDAERKILEKMKEILMVELNIDIERCYTEDYSSFLMILSAFYGERCALDIPQPSESKLSETADPRSPSRISLYPQTDEVLAKCKNPLHTLLVMCFAAFSMQKTLMENDSLQNLKTETYESLKKQLEDNACNLISHLFLSEHDGPKTARTILQSDYRKSSEEKKKGYSGYLERKFDYSREIMAIAYKAKAMKFLSQRPCKDLMKSRYDCRKNSSDGDECEKASGVLKWLRFEMSRKWKLHASFRFIYVLVFAYMLCTYPVYINDGYKARELMEFLPVFYVLLVLAAQFFMTFVKLTDYVAFHSKEAFCGNFKVWYREKLRLQRQYFRANSLAFYRQLMIASILSLETFRFFFSFTSVWKSSENRDTFWYSGWTIIPIALELLYCILFAIAAVSSLRMFHASALGFFVHLFKKMWKTVGMFVLIFVVFWFVLSVIHVSLSRTAINSEMTFVHNVLSEGKFEVFGEVKEEDRDGRLKNCEKYNRTFLHFFEMHYEEASCLFRGSILPFIVFGYMFVTGILLMNLLTAQLTKEYETELEINKNYKGYLKYEQLSRIESKLLLPPPLSLIYVIIRLPPFSWLSVCPNFWDWILRNVVEKMDGYPWGSVRQRELPGERNEKVIHYLTKNPSRIWKELEGIVSEPEGAEKLESLKRLKNILTTYFDYQINEEVERMETSLTMRREDSRPPSRLMTWRPRDPMICSPDRQSQTSQTIADLNDPSVEVNLPRRCRRSTK